MAQADDLADVAIAEAPGVSFADRGVTGLSGRLVVGDSRGELTLGIGHVKECTENLTGTEGAYRFLYMEATQNTPAVSVGQRWRQTDGYLCDVIAFCDNGWPWVRHPNAKQGGHMVNPAWFGQWELVRDA